MKKRFTQEQYKKAELVDLVDFMQKSGYVLKPEGGGFRCKEPGNIYIKGQKWYSNDRQIGGLGAISFLSKFEELPMVDVIERLTGENMQVVEFKTAEKETVEKDLILPSKNENSKRAFAYLNQTRGLDKDILNELIARGQIYESEKYHNAVFVGTDSNNNPKYACMRGTMTVGEPFKRDAPGSDKSYPFVLKGSSDKVFVFEGAIDAISLASIRKGLGRNWKQDTYLSIGGISPRGLERFLQENQGIKKIVFALDNDEAGIAATQKLEKDFKAKGYDVKAIAPRNKDWNDDLLKKLPLKETEKLFYIKH